VRAYVRIEWRSKLSAWVLSAGAPTTVCACRVLACIVPGRRGGWEGGREGGQGREGKTNGLRWVNGVLVSLPGVMLPSSDRTSLGIGRRRRRRRRRRRPKMEEGAWGKRLPSSKGVHTEPHSQRASWTTSVPDKHTRTHTCARDPGGEGREGGREGGEEANYASGLERWAKGRPPSPTTHKPQPPPPRPPP